MEPVREEPSQGVCGADSGLALPDPLLAHAPTQALVLHPEQPAGLPEEGQGALQGCWGWVSGGRPLPAGTLGWAEDTAPQQSGHRDYLGLSLCP